MRSRLLLLLFSIGACTVTNAQQPGQVIDLSEIYRSSEEYKRMQAERELLQREAEVRQREAELLAIERDRQLQNERAPPPTEQRPEVPSDPLMMAFLERIKYRRYRWEDFDDVVFAPDLQISRDMVGLMTESRYAADIAYFLGKNPQITAEIARMSLPDAGRAIFDIEKRIVAEEQDSN